MKEVLLARRDNIRPTVEDTSSGLAATSEGKYFVVPFANDGLILYQHKVDGEGASYADEILKFPTQAKVDETINGLKSRVMHVSTIAEMLSIDSASLWDGQQANVSTDRCGGTFSWDSTRQDENDGGTVLNGWVRHIPSSRVYVDWWGTTGDRYEDATDAIQSAIKAAIAISNYSLSGVPEIVFGAGVYRITKNNIFDVDGITGVRGINITGAGRAATLLYVDNTGEEGLWYLYDSQTVDLFNRSTMQQIGITAALRDKFIVARVASNGNSDKQHHYVDMIFGRDAGDGFGISGTGIAGVVETTDAKGIANADLMKFDRCIIRVDQYVMRLDNAQSVQHDITDCDILTSYDVIRINRGGDVNIRGGGIIWDSTNGIANAGYAFHYEDSANVSFGNHRCTLTGTRFEITGGFRGLVKTPADVDALTVASGISISKLDLAGALKSYFVDVGSGARVIIKDSSLCANGGVRYRLDVSNAGNSNRASADLVIDNSVLTTSGELGYVVDKFEIEGSVVAATVRVNNCFNLGERGTSQSDPYSFRMSNGLTGNSSGANLYTLSMKDGNQFFPIMEGGDTPRNERTIKLPMGAIIKSLVISKPYVDGDTSEDYQLFFGTDDKSTILAETTLQSAKNEINVEIPINRKLAANEIYRLWGGAQSVLTAGKLQGHAYLVML